MFSSSVFLQNARSADPEAFFGLVRLFQYNYSTNVLLAMNLIIGWVMMGNLFYVSLYFQNIRGTSPSDAGVLILPITIAHGITSGVTGVLVAALGRYAGIIRTGAGLWTIGAGLKAALYTGNSSTWMFIGFGILEGLGVGCSLQPGVSYLLHLIIDLDPVAYSAHSSGRIAGWLAEFGSCGNDRLS